jgi:hypothetical protein
MKIVSKIATFCKGQNSILACIYNVLLENRAVFFQAPAAPQQFRINCGKFRKLALEFQVRGNARAGLFSLGGGFQQKLFHLPRAQALHQIIERAVLESPLTAAILFPASQILFDIGGPQKIRRDIDLIQQERLLFL